MRVNLGVDAAARHRGQHLEVVWDSNRLVNGHTLLVGMSGAGKTYTLKRMISQMLEAARGVRFHVFDVHGDISIPGASETMFSEVMPYGLNPLAVNPDPHFGGPRKCIQAFISTISSTSRTPLGVKQEAVLRNLLTDLYRSRGFTDEPETWYIDNSQAGLVSDGSDNRLYLDVPYAEKEDAKAFGARWDRDLQLWWVYTEQYEGGITRWSPKTVGRTHPTLQDVLTYAQRLLVQSFMGSDQDAITKLEIFSRNAGAFQRREIEAARNGHKFEDEKQSEALEKAKAKCIESYIRYVEAMRTGNEVDDLIKYDSTETLKSVVNRLEALKATGLFKGTPAPFEHDNPVWVYKLNALSQEEKKMFVRFQLQELFARAIQRGQATGVRDVLVLDEVHLYADDDPDNILSTLSRESRKFGVSMLAANQNANLPDDFISSLATKIVLGIDEMFWRTAESKMNIERRLLEWIKPQRTMAVQMKERAATKNAWRWVVVPGASAEMPQEQETRRRAA